MKTITNPRVVTFDVDDTITYLNPPDDPEGKLKYFDIETPWGEKTFLAVNER